MEPEATPRAAPAHVPVLDGLRGLLTILVLVHHVVSSVLYDTPPGEEQKWEAAFVFVRGTTIALPMYFVISGFVIYLPAARGNGRLGDLSWYALRRVARIVPAYYLNIAVLIFTWPFLFSDVPSPMATRRGIELMLGHVVFLQKLLFDEKDIGFGLNGSVWTLTLEEFFYFTIPFVGLWFFRRPFTMLGASLALALGWRSMSFHWPEIAGALGMPAPDALLPSHLFHQFPGYVLPFALGTVASLVYVRQWALPLLEGRGWIMYLLHAFCAVSIVLCTWRVGRMTGIERGIPPDFTFDMVPAALFAGLILATAMGPPAARKLYDNRICRFLGDTSYGVYLWHMVLIQIVFRHGGLPRPPDTRSLLIYLAWVVPGSLLLGWISFAFVERPFSAWVRRVYRETRETRLAPRAGPTD